MMSTHALRSPSRIGSLLLLLVILPCRLLAQTPRIVNGTVTSAFASTGALLISPGSAPSQAAGICSGTLVGCQTFVTAAHCVCGDADNVFDCYPSSVTSPDRLRVLLQHAGIVPVAGVTISPDFAFGEAGDVAVLQLSEPVAGIIPSPINTTAKPEPGSSGTIVGFGRTMNVDDVAADAGVKREGKVTLARCNGVVPNQTHVCWQFAGTDATTCSGDSGGPLFLDLGDGPVLAGVTSGGDSGSCAAPEVSFDADVFVYRDFITRQIDGVVCGGASSARHLTTLLAQTGELDAIDSETSFQVTVPDGAARLQIVLNGQIVSDDDGEMIRNDFDLFVRHGSPPTTDTFDCADLGASVFGSCVLPSPASGPWHVLVQRFDGGGVFQLTASVLTDTPPISSCAGDCDADGEVTIDDLVRGVNVVLGRLDLSSCRAFDVNDDGMVTIDELVTAVLNAQGGCAAP